MELLISNFCISKKFALCTVNHFELTLLKNAVVWFVLDLQ